MDRTRGVGWGLSGTLHLAVAAAAILGLPRLLTPASVAPPPAISATIVTEDQLPREALPPLRADDKAKPAPAAPAPKPAAAPKPVPAPETEAKAETPPPAAPAPAPSPPPPSRAETADLARPDANSAAPPPPPAISESEKTVPEPLPDPKAKAAPPPEPQRAARPPAPPAPEAPPTQKAEPKEEPKPGKVPLKQLAKVPETPPSRPTPEVTPEAAPQPVPQAAPAPLLPTPARKPTPPPPAPAPVQAERPKPAPTREKPRNDDPLASVLASVDALKRDRPPEPSQPTPSPATSLSTAPLTASEIDAVRAQIARCWNIPAGARDAENLVVELSLRMNPDGTVRDARIVDEARARRDPFFRAAADSAVRAVFNPSCTPLLLPPDKYDIWRDLNLTFNPKELLG